MTGCSFLNVQTFTKRRKAVEKVEKSVQVDCPVNVAYNQWTQFEDFPKFMAGVKQITQIDDTHLRWKAEVGGKEKEWEAEITDQVPDRHIAWRSITDDAKNAGEVRFEPISEDSTRIHLTMEYEPEGAMENVGDALGAMDRRVQSTVDDFKEFIESRGSETGAWRGEVHGGEETRQY
ncbi:MAG: SRPBCC family protein [Haliea sp.]